MNEVIFLVEEAPEGVYIAQALGESIFTEARDLSHLQEQVRDAVLCHFEEESRPKLIRPEAYPAGPGRLSQSGRRGRRRTCG